MIYDVILSKVNDTESELSAKFSQYLVINSLIGVCVENNMIYYLFPPTVSVVRSLFPTVIGSEGVKYYLACHIHSNSEPRLLAPTIQQHRPQFIQYVQSKVGAIPDALAFTNYSVFEPSKCPQLKNLIQYLLVAGSRVVSTNHCKNLIISSAHVEEFLKNPLLPILKRKPISIWLYDAYELSCPFQLEFFEIFKQGGILMLDITFLRNFDIENQLALLQSFLKLHDGNRFGKPMGWKCFIHPRVWGFLEFDTKSHDVDIRNRSMLVMKILENWRKSNLIVICRSFVDEQPDTNKLGNAMIYLHRLYYLHYRFFFMITDNPESYHNISGSLEFMTFEKFWSTIPLIAN
ncbi:hypothetical protein HDV02_004516 [Globomyces sp. JEL0801]|nr:hypothetical protein HDV02_004516 [Globomyces sp. JEL0801]